MIDGDIVDEWYLCTPGIPNSRCTPAEPAPAWVANYTFPTTVQKPPLPHVVKYPSYIYTPGNIIGYNTWSYRAELRRRGLWSGEECFNEDLMKPYENATDADGKTFLRRRKEEDTQGQEEEEEEKVSSISFSSKTIIYHHSSFYIYFATIFVFAILPLL